MAAGVFARLVPCHPHLRPLAMETAKLLAGGYTIGRLGHCDVSLDRDYVSGQHCRLYMESDSEPGKQNLYIMDTSSNGTYVNGRVLGRNSCTILLHKDHVGFVSPGGALTSDIGLEYSVEFALVDSPSKGLP
ncbi:serine/threonine protein kinase, partial [Coemansia sp. RSA 2671]